VYTVHITVYTTEHGSVHVQQKGWAGWDGGGGLLTVKAGGERAAAAVSVKVPSEGCWAAL
jgi:hypothetical protein